MKPSIITISGLPGSGTSTVARLLAEKLRFKHVDAGTLFRQIASQLNMSLEEFGKLAERDPKIDQKLDSEMVELVRRQEPIILEGRLTGWMLKGDGIKSFKVWLKAHRRVRAERISKREDITFDRALKGIIDRERSEGKRYQEIYGIDINDLSIYDLVVEADKLPASGIVKLILDKIASWSE